MSRLNKNAIKKELEKSLKNFEKEARIEAEKAFEKGKREMLQEFNEHPITREIRDGPDANNVSNTLGGYGNLFSYIGFDANGGDPTKIVEQRLEKDTQLSKTPYFKKVGGGTAFEFKVSTVDKGALEKDTPMPFEKGKSWLTGIENGISGLSYYIYRKLLAKSRSGTGLQSDHKIRGLEYKPVKYISAILKNFEGKFK